jgi:hypothetical protein
VPNKLFNALLGVLWVVSGALMAFNPAPLHRPHDRSRAATIALTIRVRRRPGRSDR